MLTILFFGAIALFLFSLVLWFLWNKEVGASVSGVASPSPYSEDRMNPLKQKKVNKSDKVKNSGKKKRNRKQSTKAMINSVGDVGLDLDIDLEDDDDMDLSSFGLQEKRKDKENDILRDFDEFDLGSDSFDIKDDEFSEQASSGASSSRSLEDEFAELLGSEESDAFGDENPTKNSNDFEDADVGDDLDFLKDYQIDGESEFAKEIANEKTVEKKNNTNSSSSEDDLDTDELIAKLEAMSKQI